jgi:glucosyl-3-phosphoglycerate synthase
LSWIILIFVLIIAAIKTSNSHDMTVSVIIPAFNEEKTVGNVVKVIKSLNYIDEIIVVDDGSSDRTFQVAEDAGATAIKHFKNRGKGAAIKTGFKNSKGDIIVFLDADIKNLTAKQVDKIIRPIMMGEADVTKTKFKREAGRVTELTAKPLMNFFFPEIKLDQPLSGQFAAKRSFLKNIDLEDDYGVDVGIVLDADVRGMNVKEVDIGEINHQLSPLNELNLVATEVVRTIVDRANTYGRVTMIDSLGRSIRMEILGLSLVFLGFFATFFIRPIPIQLGLVISLVGIIMAIFYIIKIIRMSFNVFKREDGRLRAIKSFFYMHSPILVSGLILIAMITTLLGAVHIGDGKVSIEPTSRNLIIWKEPVQNKSIDLRGPYTVDSAVENEINTIRLPQEAMDSLELSYGDSVYINSQKYSLNHTIPGEDYVMRIPFDSRSYLGLNIRDVIRDSDLRNIFKNVYALKYLQIQNNTNITVQEGVLIKANEEPARTVNIYVNNQKVATTTGIFRNGTYNLYTNGVYYDSIVFNSLNPQNSYYVDAGSYTVKIEISNETRSDMEFIPAGQGKFLNFIY